MLFDKYSKQKAVTSDQPLKKGWGHPHINRDHHHLSGQLQGSGVNHLSKEGTLLQLGLRIRFVRSTMTMEWCGCHINNPFILDVEDQGGQLWIRFHDLHEIAGCHVSLDRFTRTTVTAQNVITCLALYHEYDCLLWQNSCVCLNAFTFLNFNY
jgi:hypothetical protein